MSEDPIKNQPPVLLSNIHRTYASLFYKELRGQGLDLTQPQWRVLALLRVEDGRTQSELAEIMLKDKAPMGVLLDKLEAKRLIERHPDSRDRRAKRIYLTEQSKPLMPLIESVSSQLTEGAFAGLSEQDREQLCRLLTTINDNLNSLRQQS